jgi:hypothetical protein
VVTVVQRLVDATTLGLTLLDAVVVGGDCFSVNDLFVMNEFAASGKAVVAKNLWQRKLHQVTSNQALLHQQAVVQQSPQSAAGCGQPMQTIGPQPLQHQLTTAKQQHQSSPAPKKFRPSYTRPSNKSARYVPKPMPQELSNLKTYSKRAFDFLIIEIDSIYISIKSSHYS